MLGSLATLFDLNAGDLGVAALVASSAFVFAKGRTAERLAVLLIDLTWLGLLCVQHLTGEIVPEIPFVASDLVLALGFLILAVRFASLWLGAGMLLEGALFFLHSTHISEHPARSYGYLVSVNVLSYCVLGTVVGAAAANWFKKMRDRRAAHGRTVTAP